MVDVFNKILLKAIAAKLSQDVGWQKIRDRPLQVMTEVLHRFMKDVSIRLYRYAEYSGRTEPSVKDITLVLQDMKIDVFELEKYKRKMVGVTAVFHISQYPVPPQEQLSLPSVESDIEDNDNARKDSEDESKSNVTPDISINRSTHSSSMKNDNADMTNLKNDENVHASSVSVDLKILAEKKPRENVNKKEELSDFGTFDLKRKNRKLKNKEVPEYFVSCRLKKTQSELKTNEILVLKKKEDIFTRASEADVTISDEFYIHLDFPKIVIKRIKAKNKTLGDSSSSEIVTSASDALVKMSSLCPCGNSHCEEIKIGASRKKMKSHDKEKKKTSQRKFK